MLRLANALVSFQACIQIMQAMVISSHEVLNPEVKEVHQSLAIIRNDDANNLWQRRISVEAVGNRLNIFANDAIKQLEQDLLVLV